MDSLEDLFSNDLDIAQSALLGVVTNASQRLRLDAQPRLVDGVCRLSFKLGSEWFELGLSLDDARKIAFRPGGFDQHLLGELCDALGVGDLGGV